MAEESVARRAAEENPGWYHTIELAPGVLTPGVVDLRGVSSTALPERVRGRALDVGTFDGFWAFELERRGAEVVAIDLPALDAAQWPPRNRARLESEAAARDLTLGRGFRIAAGALGSSVDRVEIPVHELDPERIGGPVEFAFSGAILLHLRDPVGALEAILGALGPGGELRIMEPFSVRDSLLGPRRPIVRFRAAETSFDWWLPNLAALAAWMHTAGFERVERLAICRPHAAEPEMRHRYAVLRGFRPS